ncbi:MAG: hypothetical protein Q8M86_00020 [Syntrophales bacterium]|nr:hypothetical protein [Syntrophales bacterium]
MSDTKYPFHIAQSGLSIFEPITDRNLWIPTSELEVLLNKGLRGRSLKGLPLRTRSKVLKQWVCQVLGYPIPPTFKKTRPRFLGQSFDTYIQKSNNLQIWNEDITPTRRYVVVRLIANDTIEKVKVVTGDVLAALDTTGTLTQKYQARLTIGTHDKELVVHEDTVHLKTILKNVDFPTALKGKPTDQPDRETLLPIREIFQRLSHLVGKNFLNAGYDQERNRGAELHRLVCRTLGYENYQDDGRFPDIRHQLLEVKLQTSPTIDLGLVRPDSEGFLDLPALHGVTIRHCDVRYILFYARIDGDLVSLTHMYLTTGEAFSRRFQQFQGKVVNRKLQIPLPNDFFD